MKKTVVYRFGRFELRPDDYVLLDEGAPVPLTPKAFDTLAALVRRPGATVSREELMRDVWPDTFVEDGGLTQNISVLRKVLGAHEGRDVIETVPRRGYRFAAAVESVDTDAREPLVEWDARDSAGRIDYVEGRRHLAHRTIEHVHRAIAKFERAIELDAGFAPAFAALAEACTVAASAEYAGERWVELMARAKSAAARALAIDDGLPQAHASLARVHFRLDWNWALAEAEFRRALALNPRDADSHHAFAFYLIAMERRDEARAAAAEAHRLQPVAPVLGTGLGRILSFAGEHDLAIQQLERVRDLEPSFAQVHFDLSFALAAEGRLDEAIAACRTAITLSPGRPVSNAVLANYLARAGREADARAALEDLQRRVHSGDASPFDLAVVHVGLGDIDRALEQLRAACRERHGLLVYLRVEQLWNPLRRDARFDGLLRQIGLVQQF